MDRIEQMKGLREKGMPLRSIGEVFGISRERVRQLIGNTGRVAAIYASPEDVEAMKRLREEGLSFGEIATLTGFHAATVSSQTGRLPRCGYGRKWCSLCKTAKLEDEFYDGRRICKKCDSEKMLKYWRKHYAPGCEKHGESLVRLQTEAKIRQGKLNRPTKCEHVDGTCSKRVIAHHPNYNKPDSIIGLCDRHHRLEHLKLAQVKALSCR